MQINKIAIGKKVIINYTEQINGTDRTVTLKSDEQSVLGFKQLFNSFTVDAGILMDMKPGYCQDMKTNSITITHKEETIGCVITVQKPVSMSNSPLVLHTPFTMETISPEATIGLPVNTISKLNSLMGFAIGFIEGERGESDQTELTVNAQGELEAV